MSVVTTPSDVQLSYGLKVLNGVPSDPWYGPYGSIEDANDTVPVAIRKVGIVDGYIMGRTVGIVTVDGQKEYWWDGGTADGDLIEKAGGSNLIPGSGITFSDNGDGTYSVKVGGDIIEDTLLQILDDHAFLIQSNGRGFKIIPAAFGGGSGIDDGTLGSAFLKAGGSGFEVDDSNGFNKSIGILLISRAGSNAGELRIISASKADFIGIKVPEGLSETYTITLPPELPTDTPLYLTMDSTGQLVLVTGSGLPTSPPSNGKMYRLIIIDGVTSWEETIDNNGTSIDVKEILQAGLAGDWDLDDHYIGDEEIEDTKGGMEFPGTDAVSGAKYIYKCYTDNNWYRTQRIVNTLYLRSPSDGYKEFTTDDSGVFG